MSSYNHHKFNNHVVEVRNRTHGAMVISWWIGQGITTSMSGSNTKEEGDSERYYGLCKGNFTSFSMYEIDKYGLTIIKIEDYQNGTGEKIKENTKHKIKDFKVGDEVMFNSNNYNGRCIDNYEYDDGIPRELTNTRGSLYLSNNRGKVTAIHGQYVIVEYLDDYGDKPRLGFLTEYLTIINKNQKNTSHGENSIEVQRPVATVNTGKRKPGNRISGRRSKTTVSVGHLSNEAVTGY